MLLLTLLLAAARAGSADAQSLVVEGRVDHPANEVLTRVLARGDYLLIERDTVLEDDVRLLGDLVIVRSDVRLAGEVEGAVVVVHGALFTRPGSRIGREIASIGGELYLTRLGDAGEVYELPPAARSELTYAPGAHRLSIISPAPPPRFGAAGPLGITVLSYDRVNGITGSVGAWMLLRRDTIAPLVRGSVSYASALRRPGGTLGLELPLGGWWATAEVARGSFTNEGWIRGPLMNSLSTLGIRSDVRNYYEADVARVRLERRQRQPLIQGERFFGPRLEVRASRDRSLTAANAWSVLKRDEEWRGNPEIDEGTVVSLVPGAAMEWRGARSRFLGDVALELAPGMGDFEFTHLVAHGLWEMPSLRDHRITIRGRTHQTIGADPAPRQRWSFIGGAGTLPTLDLAEMRGDRLALVDTRYDIPLGWVRVPILGSPDLRFQHMTGAAWVTGESMPPWEQSLGVGLRFFLLEALVHIDPAAESLDPVFSIGTGFEF